MTQALSNDLRKRVVAAVLGGESCHSVASRFRGGGFLGSDVIAAISLHRLGCASQDGWTSQTYSGAASCFYP